AVEDAVAVDVDPCVAANIDPFGEAESRREVAVKGRETERAPARTGIRLVAFEGAPGPREPMVGKTAAEVKPHKNALRWRKHTVGKAIPVDIRQLLLEWGGAVLAGDLVEIVRPIGRGGNGVGEFGGNPQFAADTSAVFRFLGGSAGGGAVRG